MARQGPCLISQVRMRAFTHTCIQTHTHVPPCTRAYALHMPLCSHSGLRTDSAACLDEPRGFQYISAPTQRSTSKKRIVGYGLYAAGRRYGSPCCNLCPSLQEGLSSLSCLLYRVAFCQKPGFLADPAQVSRQSPHRKNPSLLSRPETIPAFIETPLCIISLTVSTTLAVYLLSSSCLC